jgi:hypothetical protein
MWRLNEVNSEFGIILSYENCFPYYDCFEYLVTLVYKEFTLGEVKNVIIEINRDIRRLDKSKKRELIMQIVEKALGTNEFDGFADDTYILVHDKKCVDFCSCLEFRTAERNNSFEEYELMLERRNSDFPNMCICLPNSKEPYANVLVVGDKIVNPYEIFIHHPEVCFFVLNALIFRTQNNTIVFDIINDKNFCKYSIKQKIFRGS